MSKNTNVDKFFVYKTDIFVKLRISTRINSKKCVSKDSTVEFLKFSFRQRLKFFSSILRDVISVFSSNSVTVPSERVGPGYSSPKLTTSYK